MGSRAAQLGTGGALSALIDDATCARRDVAPIEHWRSSRHATAIDDKWGHRLSKSFLLGASFTLSLLVAASTTFAADRVGAGLQKFSFERGRGIPVCESYFERLTKTTFELAPFCGRPENDVEGKFPKLVRVYLTPEELLPLRYRLQGFVDGDQFAAERTDAKRRAAGTTPAIGTAPAELENLRGSIASRQVAAWRYEPPIDLDNDGVADNILVWQQGRCGDFEGNDPGLRRGLTIVLVLDSENKQVDEARTRELIGHPTGSYPTPDGKGKYRPFRPIGRSMGIFSFEGEIYFDTFFDLWGDFTDRRRNDRALADTLSVFKRKNGRTEQICEYRWDNPTIRDTRTPK